MFLQCVENLADEEQKAKWLTMIKQVKMVGCYVQTEMGHGSNVAVITAFFENNVGDRDNSHIR